MIHPHHIPTKKTILFLCTGNSARSIMAEAYLNHAANNHWQAYSAGSKPTGKPNPFALETLANHNIDSFPPEAPARSKSWDEFATPNAPIMDIIVTVCSNAAHETCPIWPTNKNRAPQSLHWGFPDPAAIVGTNEAIRTEFESVFTSIRTQIDTFLENQNSQD